MGKGERDVSWDATALTGMVMVCYKEISFMSVSRQVQISDRTSNGCSDPHHWTYLMCPPDHYRVFYEINPWMNRTNQPDLDLARKQWYNLVSNLKKAGATVEVLRPVASLPDMVFTADIGLIDQHRFVMSHFRYPQRRPEARHGADWFRDRNSVVRQNTQ